MKLHRRYEISTDTPVVVLAGGQGERLYPLTRDRSKPAVPFGGLYRIIDFTLSNCINSGLRQIYVLTQYKSFSLDSALPDLVPSLAALLRDVEPEPEMVVVLLLK